IANDVAHPESQRSRLASAEEFAGAAELKVALGDIESVARFGKQIETIFFLVGNENAVRLSLAAPDAAAKLMQMRHAETISVDDQHDRRVRHIDADLQRLEVQFLRLFDDGVNDVDLRAGADLVVDEFVDAFQLRARSHRGLD